MSELKPCPFCGGEAILLEDSFWETYNETGRNTVVCNSCGATMLETKERRDVVAAWNERAESDELRGLLRDILDNCMDGVLCSACGKAHDGECELDIMVRVFGAMGKVD